MTSGSTYVFLFEMRDPETGEWGRSQRLATAAAIRNVGARQVPGSGRLVFPELIGADGFVTASYAAALERTS